MSDIPLARRVLKDAIRDGEDLELAIRRALKYMTRVPYARKAPAKRKVITKSIRAGVKRMCKERKDLTVQEIATHYGLRNGGRVSEILHGTR